MLASSSGRGETGKQRPSRRRSAASVDEKQCTGKVKKRHLNINFAALSLQLTLN